MPRQPRVVIVGAGLAGCALADELSERGWTNVTVLEREALPVAGEDGRREPVFAASRDKTTAEFARYTAAKYRELTVGTEHCFEQTGSLEVAVTPARMRELRRAHGWARSWGLPSRLLDPAECVRTYPLLDPRELTGGLYLPGDGLLEPARAAEAQARRAGQRGVRFLEHHAVTGIGHHANRARTVHTEQGDFRAEIVVVCAGKHVGPLAASVGLELPAVALCHQYGETTPVRGLDEPDGGDRTGTWPLLRHRDAGVDIQQHGGRLTIDSYTTRPTSAAPEWARFRPEEFDLAWKACLRLLPALAEREIDRGVAGQLTTTPDGNPLLGEHPDIDGLWFAAAAPHAQSAGVARALAQWLVDGQPEPAVHAHELHRFDRSERSPAYVAERATAWLDSLRTPGDRRRPAVGVRAPRSSPFHERQAALGACFTDTAGWADPLWYRANAELPEAGEDAAAARAEARVARGRAAMLDLSSRRRLDITGPEAWNFLQTLTTNQLDPEPGSVTRTLLLTEDGGVRAELTVACLGENDFQLSCESNADVVWLRRQLPPGGKVTMQDNTAGTCCLALCGPRAIDVLAPLATWDVGADTAGGADPGSLRVGYVGVVPVRAQRSSYAGVPGWELCTSADMGRQLWDALWDAGGEHGMVAAGRAALRSMRMEAGLRDYATDVTAEHDPFEAGMGAAVRMDKGYFLGREGLIERLAAPALRSLCCLRLDAAGSLPESAEPVYAGAEVVGYVTGAAPGYTTGTTLAYAWVDCEHADLGTPLEIDHLGTKLPAVVAPAPLTAAAW